MRILEEVGKVAYSLALLLSRVRVHNVFYMSLLRKYTLNLDQIVELEQLKIQVNLTQIELLINIVDTKEQQLRRRVFEYEKVQ